MIEVKTIVLCVLFSNFNNNENSNFAHVAKDKLVLFIK